MSKIGILGGTFNPIHNGHITLAKAAKNQLLLDKVLIMPTGVSYLKASQSVQPKEVRAEMVRLAVRDESGLEFSDIEVNREGNTYTYETLLSLKATNPNDDLYFLIGADTLFSIENWKEPQIIFDNCIIAVMVRDNANLDDLNAKIKQLVIKYNTKCEIITADRIDISSTYIREQIHLGNSAGIKDLLPEAVYEYIVNESIYL